MFKSKILISFIIALLNSKYITFSAGSYPPCPRCNVPWGTYGIHGTIIEESIGSSASHGCIRMFNLDVQELYKIVPVGTEVVIVEGSFGPFGSGFKDIEVGDRGADVVAIQVRLKKLGYFKGWESGVYEDDLKLALHRFQKEKGLEIKNTISKEDWLKMGFREFE